MADINSTIMVAAGLFQPLHDVLRVMQYLIGGVFGLYLVNGIYNWYRLRKIGADINVLKQEISEIKNQLIVLTTPKNKTGRKK